MRKRWYQRRCQDLVRGARNESSTAKRRRSRDRDHWHTYGRPIRPWPQNFLHNFSGEISTDSTGILIKYIQFRNSIYRFPKERRAIHLCWNRFIFEKLYTSKFNTTIYKTSSTSDSVLRPLSGLRPCTSLVLNPALVGRAPSGTAGEAPYLIWGGAPGTRRKIEGKEGKRERKEMEGRKDEKGKRRGLGEGIEQNSMYGISFLPERDYFTFGSSLSQIRLSVCNVHAPYSSA